MILVDIEIPAVSHTYDFQLEEGAVIDAVIEELCELIEQKEQCKLAGASGDLMLCVRDTRQILPRGLTMAVCGVQTGARLILV